MRSGEAPSAPATDALIDQLAASARAVRRLPSPGRRAAWWLGIVLVAAIVLAVVGDRAEAFARITSAPDMWLAILGSVATTILAAIAACIVSVPGYSRRWAWLPLPAAALWLAASGVGCLRGVALAALHPASWSEAMVHCLPFVLRTSAVLAIPLAVLLWWARPLRPGLVAVQGGLAVAAGSASLLWFIHPFDASYEDLAVHVGAVLLVIAICRLVALIPHPERRLRRAG